VQQNVRLLSIDNVLPLKQYDYGEILRNEIPSKYYLKNVSDEEKETFYSISTIPLVHGMGMDIYPSGIVENSIKEYKIILDNWKRDIPNSIKLNYEFGWYNFLISNYDTAVLFINRYIKALESGKVRNSASSFSAGIALSLEAKCYDLEGNRISAKDYYNKAALQLQKDKQERFIDFLVTPYLKEPYKK
jgi:tetratricopeptide (TPR) repeat protein